jgi:hypothetical protein
MPQKFIKDSANNYTLYVDQGTDYEITINASTFGVNDITNLTFFGSIRMHPNSKKFEDFVITKIGISNTINLKITNTSTSALKHSRYQFDLFYKTQNNEIFRALGGEVFVRNNISSQ